MIRWLIVVVALLAIAGTCWFSWPTRQEPRVLVVDVQPIPRTLDEHAVLISAQRTAVKCGMSGMITRMVPSGTSVAIGDAVFSQEEADLAKKIEEKQVEIEEQQAALEEHRQGLALTELEIAKQEEVIESELAYHRARIAEVNDGPDPADSRLMAIDLELARIDLDEAREALERSKRLVERGLQSATQLEADQRTYDTRAVAVRELEIQQALLKAGPTLIEVREIEADLERVQGKVERLKQSRERKIQRIHRDIAIRQAQITRSTSELDNLQEDIGHATVFAPTAGIAMPRRYRDWRAGGRMVEVGPGVQRWTGDVLVDIVDPSKLQAVIMINEADYPRVQPGMAATVRLAAYPERSYPGTLSFIAGLGRDRGEISISEMEGPDTGVSVFSATIDFQADVELRPGMTGVVEIALDDLDDAVVIPRDWVIDDGQAQFVWAETDRGVQRLAINGEAYGSNGLRITNGLRPGDRLRHPDDVGTAH